MRAEVTDMGGYTLTENAALLGRNTMRVDARASLLADIHDAAKLPELLDFPAIRQRPLLVLGEGSNMLFTGDFDGTVLAMATRGVQLEHDGDIARIAVAAGERKPKAAQPLVGLENAVGRRVVRIFIDRVGSDVLSGSRKAKIDDADAGNGKISQAACSSDNGNRG